MTVAAEKNRGSVPTAEESTNTVADFGMPWSARCSRRKYAKVETPRPTNVFPSASTKKSNSAFCSDVNAANNDNEPYDQQIRFLVEPPSYIAERVTRRRIH
jgi:hypothetical protein